MSLLISWNHSLMEVRKNKMEMPQLLPLVWWVKTPLVSNNEQKNGHFYWHWQFFINTKLYSILKVTDGTVWLNYIDGTVYWWDCLIDIASDGSSTSTLTCTLLTSSGFWNNRQSLGWFKRKKTKEESIGTSWNISCSYNQILVSLTGKTRRWITGSFVS